MNYCQANEKNPSYLMKRSMKIILSSKIHHYVKRLSIFLIIVALIAGMVGCASSESYALAIISTDGGNVTTPGEGIFTYGAGTVVDLVATPDVGYCLVNWTGDVDTIANVSAAATNITMNGDYVITANFVQGQAIRDWYDLDGVSNNLSGIYVLTNNLDSTTAGYEELASETANDGKGWEPIGPYDEPYDEHFTGTFDGQGYEIRDLFINRPAENGIGLFGWVVEKGVIKNVGVVGVVMTGFALVGALVGYNQGTVRNSHSAGSVTGDRWVGGLVGLSSWCTVTDSYSTANVDGSQNVGGLVGWNLRTAVSNSYATGNVTGFLNVGGLVGWNDDNATVSNSYSTGSVTGNTHVGGLVGENDAYVSSSYSTGGVSGNDDVGGLVGHREGYVSFSFWDTETSGQSTSDGGTGKTTAEMQDIDTFTDTETPGLYEPWDMIAVANPGTRNSNYIWNIVDDETYPFLSWQS